MERFYVIRIILKSGIYLIGSGLRPRIQCHIRASDSNWELRLLQRNFT